eukprot:GFUD01010275.1.p1 GENE.GFUD01010275.1~~GFUD01010275.1.p1  ORF type:complete len:558 (+),score=98.53 GFUD01010275.1:34-1707(+)
MRLLLITLVIGWVTSQQVGDQEPNYWDILHPSSTAWFLNDFYAQSFGILHNVTKLQTLDIRQTNVFLEIQPLQWSGGMVQNMIYSLVEMAIGSYLKDVVGGSQREWNEEEMYYDIPEMEPDRSGSLEEIFRFQAKYLEGELAMPDTNNIEFQSWVNKSLSRLPNPKIYHKSNKDVESYVNDNLERMLNPDRAGRWFYKAVAYNDWTGKMGDRLRNHLKNIVFFQKTEDNPLNGGHDILTFLVINPKVMQSPKIKPLLRMTLTKKILEFQEFDKYLFKFLDCFVAEFGESSLIYMLAFHKEDLVQNINKLKKAYEANFSDEKTKDSFYWIDLANAILNEFEALDTDDLFYKLYVLALKIRSFLLKLDIEKKIYPQYQQINILLNEAYFSLLKNPQSLVSALKLVQTETFWENSYGTYDRLLQAFRLPSCPSLLDCFGSILPSAHIWRDFPAVEDVFKLELTEDGHQAFAATEFFRKYRKTNQKSLFQLKLDMIDPRTIVDKLVKYLRMRGIEIFRFFEGEMVQLFGNSTLFEIDWSTFGTLEKKIKDNLVIILMELEI